MNCIVCEKILEQLYPEWQDTKLDETIWDDAEVNEFVCRFGSKFDLNIYYVGLCDDCLDRKIQSGIVKLSRTYGPNRE